MNFEDDDHGRERKPRLPGCYSLSIGGPKSGGIGNSGPSSSNQETDTNSQDITGAAGSINTATNLNLEGGTNTLTLTDHGAVSGSLQLALKGIEGAQQTTQTALASTGGLLEGALKRSGEQSAAFTDTIKDIKTSDVRVLVVAGLAVVGLGAVMLFKGKA